MLRSPSSLDPLAYHQYAFLVIREPCLWSFLLCRLKKC